MGRCLNQRPLLAFLFSIWKSVCYVHGNAVTNLFSVVFSNCSNVSQCSSVFLSFYLCEFAFFLHFSGFSFCTPALRQPCQPSPVACVTLVNQHLFVLLFLLNVFALHYLVSLDCIEVLSSAVFFCLYISVLNSSVNTQLELSLSAEWSKC